MAIGIKNRQKIIEHIASLDNFVIGNMRGAWYPNGTGPTVGKLPPELRRSLRGTGHVLEDMMPVYVVYSYDTPIAWRRPGGPWRRPEVRYSVTTSHHQSLAAQGARGWDAKCESAVGAHL